VLNKTVYDESALKESFSKPVVGQIPEWLLGSTPKEKAKSRRDMQKALRRSGGHTKGFNYAQKIMNNETPYSIVEAFKALRTNMTYAAGVEGNCPVFSVTSPLSGDGKSLVATNLAISFAQLDKKVLLIDGDMRCPVQHRAFSIPREHYGISETLAGISKSPFTECVVKTQYEGLDVMPCGHIPPNPSELLASEQMGKFLAEAREKYDYIFIDLPPVCEMTDAGVLAPLVSAYVLVVRAGYCTLDMVEDALENLAATRGNVAGFVINDLAPKGGSYMRYGRYSRYGRYGRYSRYGRYGRYSHYAKDGGVGESTLPAAEQAPAAEPAAEQGEQA